jgi:hypothetical protein
MMMNSGGAGVGYFILGMRRRAERLRATRHPHRQFPGLYLNTGRGEGLSYFTPNENLL